MTDHGLLSGLSDDDHTQYQLRSEEDAANGYAGLDASSLLDPAQVPINTVTEKTTPVAADKALIADSADSNNRKMAQLGNFPVGAIPTFSAASDGDSSTTGEGFTEKVKLTFTAEAADYLIFYSAEIRTSDSSTLVEAQLEQDDTTQLAFVDYTPDRGIKIGYGPFSGVVRVTLTAASHDFDIDFSSSISGKTVNIRRARIHAMKVT